MISILIASVIADSSPCSDKLLLQIFRALRRWWVCLAGWPHHVRCVSRTVEAKGADRDCAEMCQDGGGESLCCAENSGRFCVACQSDWNGRKFKLLLLLKLTRILMTFFKYARILNLCHVVSLIFWRFLMADWGRVRSRQRLHSQVFQDLSCGAKPGAEYLPDFLLLVPSTKQYYSQFGDS